MEKKKLSKLVLRKETVSNLSKSQQALILGGSNQFGCKSYYDDSCESGELYTPDPCDCGSETCVCPEGLHSA